MELPIRESPKSKPKRVCLEQIEQDLSSFVAHNVNFYYGGAHTFWWRTACTRSETVLHPVYYQGSCCHPCAQDCFSAFCNPSNQFSSTVASIRQHISDTVKWTVLSSKLKATWFLCKTMKHSENWCALTSWHVVFFSLILTKNDSVYKVNYSFVTICTIINTRFPQWITKYWSAAENSPNTQISLD